MDLTVDVTTIPVEPEYPVHEIHSTETYFLNKRKVQMLQEVQNKDLSVEEFLAQIESVRANVRAGEGAPERDSEMRKESAPSAIQEAPGAKGTERSTETTNRIIASGKPVKEGPVPDPILRPHADKELEPGVDLFSVYFSQDGHELDSIDREVIETLPDDQCFRVAGFASPEGSKWYNYRLSVQRAETVGKAIEKEGKTVLAVGGLGEFSAHIWSHPWPMERRVEIYPVSCPAQEE